MDAAALAIQVCVGPLEKRNQPCGHCTAQIGDLHSVCYLVLLDNTKRVWAPFVGLAIIVLTIATPETNSSDEDPYDLNANATLTNQVDDSDDDDDERGVRYVKVVALILLGFVALFHLLHIVFLFSPEGSKMKETLGEHAMQDEIDLKMAQAHKLNCIVVNACELHRRDDKSSVLRTCFGHGIYEYSKSAEKDIVVSGGFIWGWKLIWSKNIFRCVIVHVLLL